MEGFILLAAVAEYVEEQRALAAEKRRLRDTMDPFDLPDQQFHAYFRLSKDITRYLCDSLRPSLVRQRSHGLSVESQVFAALRFFAVGSYQGCVGQDILVSMSQSSVCNSIHAVSRGIRDVIGSAWVKFPTTAHRRQMLKQRFHEAQGLKGVIGCIDCTQVAIFKPTEHEEAYVNHKSYHSLNVEAVASYDLEFLSLNARYPGSVHDAFIWKNCPIRDLMIQQWDAGDHNSWLLGDSGYPLEPWLMTPVLNAPEGSPEERYTSAHCRTRCCVERAFGVLKNTFRCLLRHRTLHCHPINASAIITACAVLHNIRVHNRLPDVEAAEEAVLEEDRHEDMEGEQNGDRQREAMRIRNSLVRNFEN